MKQMSIFIMLIIFLNIFVLIQNENKLPNIKVSDIRNSNYYKTQAKNLNSFVKNSKHKENMTNHNQNKENDIEQLRFSKEKLYQWLDHLESQDIKAMENSILDKNLEEIQMASQKIRDYLEESAKKVKAAISLIDLKVKEIKVIDNKIINIRPEYKKQLKKGSLLLALEKEKNNIDEVIDILKTNANSMDFLRKKSIEVEKELNAQEILNQIKEKINFHLIKFVKISNFQPAYKRLIDLLKSNYQDQYMNLIKENKSYNKSQITDMIAVKHIQFNWRNILNEESNIEQIDIAKEGKLDNELNEEEVKENNESEIDLENNEVQEEVFEEEIQKKIEIEMKNEDVKKSMKYLEKLNSIRKEEREELDYDDEKNREEDDHNRNSKNGNEKNGQSEFDLVKELEDSKEIGDSNFKNKPRSKSKYDRAFFKTLEKINSQIKIWK